ncbi:uncharacterized protein BCR38DRAFT_459768 [Pseudomassariella vexata]|uniref:Rhodopsin domain-containing protein n=1 Tax=Pseudomassariella vexata TaxID=1141098 RepID=A0A1Y2DQ49_9PEZI|nr:uncharacterized protein BCR38DRAFT_459768 [Pseudomassariella vexata]ORY60785.1 hypothetical protein BCR38DRAFT_459768 [Pseudomassariella vexata]
MVITVVDAAIAAGRVPNNTSADYLNESRDRETIIIIFFVYGLTFVFVNFRIWSRVFLIKRFGLDDGLAVLSLILTIPFLVISYKLTEIGSTRHYAYLQYVMSEDDVGHNQSWDVLGHIFYTTVMLLCRLSGLAFYYDICSSHPGFLLSMKILAGILVTTYIPQLFVFIFHCVPISGLRWPYEFQPEWAATRCIPWGVVYRINSSLSFVCDVLLFILPVSMLHSLYLSRRRKIQLACVILPGIFVIGISAARLILITQCQWDADHSWEYGPLLAVEVSEIGFTLIALSIPGIKPLFDKMVLHKDLHGSSWSISQRRRIITFRPRGSKKRHHEGV